MFDAKSILKFLKTLGKNNNKAWFDENRKNYQGYRLEWLKFTEYLLGELGDLNPVFFEMDPRKCIYRINRDVRFSKDKSPYKTNFGAYFVPGGKKSGNAGYYVHAEPGNCFLAAGVYAPESANLRKLREYTAAHYKDLEKILKDPKLTKNFVEGFREEKMKLVRPPKGFEKDHPAIELLKLKHFIIIHNFTDKEFLSADFPKVVSQRFSYLQDVVDYLNRGLMS